MFDISIYITKFSIRKSIEFPNSVALKNHMSIRRWINNCVNTEENFLALHCETSFYISAVLVVWNRKCMWKYILYLSKHKKDWTTNDNKNEYFLVVMMIFKKVCAWHFRLICVIVEVRYYKSSHYYIFKVSGIWKIFDCSGWHISYRILSYVISTVRGYFLRSI